MSIPKVPRYAEGLTKSDIRHEAEMRKGSEKLLVKLLKYLKERKADA